MNGLHEFGRSGYGWTLLSTVIIVAYLFPVYWMVATSLKTNTGIYASPPQIVPWPPVFSSYYEAVINNPLTLRSIFNSAVVGVGHDAVHAAAGGAGRLCAGAPGTADRRADSCCCC